MKPIDLKALLAEWQEQDSEHDDLEVVEEGEWSQDHKSQYLQTVYRHKPTDRFLCITQSRQGSYHTDWYYDDPSIGEVYPHVVTTTEYRGTPA